MIICLSSYAIKGGPIMKTTPERAAIDMEILAKSFQKRGYYVTKASEYVFDVSRLVNNSLKFQGSLFIDCEE